MKVRGFRIEPAEIEAQLGVHASVREAVVVALADGEGTPRLVAYVAAEAGTGAGTLRAHLRERLPEQTVPSDFIFLDILPLTPSGKVDRTSLPAPAPGAGRHLGAADGPATGGSGRPAAPRQLPPAPGAPPRAAHPSGRRGGRALPRRASASRAGSRAPAIVPEDLSPERFERLWDVFRAHALAAATYRARPLATGALLILAENRTTPADADTARWAALATGGLRSVMVPGVAWSRWRSSSTRSTNSIQWPSALRSGIAARRGDRAAAAEAGGGHRAVVEDGRGGRALVHGAAGHPGGSRGAGSRRRRGRLDRCSSSTATWWGPRSWNGTTRYFSVVFSDFFLFDGLLVLEREGLDEDSAHLLRELQLDHKVTVADGRLSTTDVSQGQRKRLALLTAILEDRPIYLFDEWAADQDPQFKRVFYHEILPRLRERGKTVFAISHDDRYYHLADRLIKLDSGRVVQDQPGGGLLPLEIELVEAGSAPSAPER